MKRLFVIHAVWECLLVTGVGCALALAANALNPDGVHLARDYFPRRTPPAVPPTQPATAPETVEQPAATTSDEFDKPFLDAVGARLQQQGFQVIRHDEVVTLFHDPVYQNGHCAFVDARGDALYNDGHIPGAYQLDHYHIENYIDIVLPACMAASRVIVYCNGGECEDSEFAALELMDRGLDPSKVCIYPGGFGLWQRTGQPVEQGARDSGHIIQPQASPADDASGGGVR